MERVIYDSGNVRISTTAAKIAGTTYPMAGITSVRRTSTPPAYGSAVVLFMAAGGAGLLAALGLASAPGWGTVILLGVTAVFGGLGVYSYREAHSRYQVRIGTSSGERAGLDTANRELAEEVCAAIEEAIASR